MARLLGLVRRLAPTITSAAAAGSRPAVKERLHRVDGLHGLRGVLCPRRPAGYGRARGAGPPACRSHGGRGCRGSRGGRGNRGSGCAVLVDAARGRGVDRRPRRPGRGRRPGRRLLRVRRLRRAPLQLLLYPRGWRRPPPQRRPGSRRWRPGGCHVRDRWGLELLRGERERGRAVAGPRRRRPRGGRATRAARPRASTAAGLQEGVPREQEGRVATPADPPAPGRPGRRAAWGCVGGIIVGVLVPRGHRVGQRGASRRHEGRPTNWGLIQKDRKGGNGGKRDKKVP